MHKVERIVDKSIPYLLILLLFVIAVEIIYASEIEPYIIFFSIFDGTIIFVFIVDLIFKYIRIRNFPKFFRTHWLEIIAVFPAFLVIRVVEEFVIIANLEETFVLSQEGLELEARVGSRASRLHYFAKFARPLSRIPRFLKAFSFYEKPTGKHHPHKKK